MIHKQQKTIRRIVWMALSPSMTFLNSCGQDSGGPCNHTYRSPIIEINSVVVAGTNAPVRDVTIRQVALNGQAVELSQLVQVPAHGVTLQGGVLVCTVPCGLGTSGGTYRLLMEGGGKPPQAVEVNAQYQIFHGGCPSWNEGGTSVAVELGP